MVIGIAHVAAYCLQERNVLLFIYSAPFPLFFSKPSHFLWSLELSV